jgi:peptidoglycan hydrolase-like protein with peptidoglycan-binding domain
MVSVPIDIDSMAQAIRDYKAIGMCLAGLNNDTWLSANPLPPTTTEGDWGHFMCSTTEIPVPVNGVKELPFYQSWGLEVADGTGIQNFGEAYINSGYIYDVFTFTRFIFNNDLSAGSIGTDVKYLQVKLGMSPKTLGFGVFGPKTFLAVQEYQKAHNISATGYVGVLTRASLNS